MSGRTTTKASLKSRQLIRKIKTCLRPCSSNAKRDFAEGNQKKVGSFLRPKIDISEILSKYQILLRLTDDRLSDGGEKSSKRGKKRRKSRKISRQT